MGRPKGSKTINRSVNRLPDNGNDGGSTHDEADPTAKQYMEKYAGAKDVRQVVIVGPQLKVMVLRLEGQDILVTHRFDEKSKLQILGTLRDEPEHGKRVKDPKAEYEAAKYLDPDSNQCIPAKAFKSSAVRGSKSCNFDMIETKGLFFTTSLGKDKHLVPIHFESTRMREDMVRIGRAGSPEPRYRPEYSGWHCDIRILYDRSRIRPEQIIAFFAAAGFSVGVGENRPEKTGDTWGQYIPTVSRNFEIGEPIPDNCLDAETNKKK